MLVEKIRPTLDAGVANLARNQFVAPANGRVPPAALVQGANLRPLIVGQQRSVDRAWKGAPSKLRRCAQVNQGHVVGQQVGWGHGPPWGDWVRRL